MVTARQPCKTRPCYRAYKRTLQQDGAPSHTARSTVQHLQLTRKCHVHRAGHVGSEEKTRIFDDCTNFLTPPHQRTPTNIGISLISPETEKPQVGLHLWRWQYAHLRLFSNNQCLKTRARTVNDSTRKTVFNAEWLFKVIQGHPFHVDEKRMGNYILRHNNFGLI